VLGVIRKLKAWWSGDDQDPEARAEAERIRQDMETLRTGSLTGPANVSHRGKDSTGGF
jgi:hypothetical protein